MNRFLAIGLGTAAAIVVFLLPTFSPVLGCVRSDVWPRTLIGLHVVSDFVIAFSYAWIPMSLLMLWRARRDIPVNWTLICFAAFIVLCGVGHALEVLVVWRPLYWLTGEVKVATALVSISTAVLLRYRVLPQLLAIPSLDAIHAATRRAEEEAAMAYAASAELAKVNERLMSQTTELQQAIQRIRCQDAAIRELSTPVLPLHDRVLLSPIIGTLDSPRAAQLAEEMLTAVRAHRAAVVILDLAGVAVVDAAVATALLRIVDAIRLLGAACVITGIRPAVAQTMVTLGIDLSAVDTRADVREGLRHAMKILSRPATAG
ncbi:STAS domain-containing protein [Polyangium jinanense]|uniref:STAS domain-containing protein n=1 Tax=Polyangium jinanense TaxID=2829994 RepID=A0A9X3XEB4_9BACT|nr:STAS domain-containing protein [Polyangium jinanense]MDC3957048.1 STAS domain-containing protein [Polyangium jinanense]MDC3987078.1 STAS domain-containing protein [Polyangium jinanense]